MVRSHCLRPGLLCDLRLSEAYQSNITVSAHQLQKSLLNPWTLDLKKVLSKTN